METMSCGLDELHLYELELEEESSSSDIGHHWIDSYNQFVRQENDILNSIEELFEFLVRRCCKSFKHLKDQFKAVLKNGELGKELLAKYKRNKSEPLELEIRYSMVTRDLIRAFDRVEDMIDGRAMISPMFSENSLESLITMRENLGDMIRNYRKFYTRMMDSMRKDELNISFDRVDDDGFEDENEI